MCDTYINKHFPKRFEYHYNKTLPFNNVKYGHKAFENQISVIPIWCKKLIHIVFLQPCI